MLDAMGKGHDLGMKLINKRNQDILPRPLEVCLIGHITQCD